MEASLLAVEGESVKFQMRTGSLVTVPLVKLSAADQQYLKNQPISSAVGVPAPVATDSNAPGAEKTWPRSVGIEDTIEIEIVKEDEVAKEFVYRSPHYEFICDSKLGGNVVKEFGRVFEATYLLNCKLPLDLKPEPEALRTIFQARLFTEKEDYYKAGALAGSGGFYHSGIKALMVPLSSLGIKMVGSRVSLEHNSDDDNRTLIHEITHQMMSRLIRFLPVWYTEGSAEYVSMLDYNRTGRYSLAAMSRNLQKYMQWRDWNGAGKTFTMIDLEELMNLDYRRWAAAFSGKKTLVNPNYGSAALLTYYFYHLDGDGDAAHITACMHEVEKSRTIEESYAAMDKHLFRGRTYVQISEDIKKTFRKEGLEITFHPPGKNGTASPTK